MVSARKTRADKGLVRITERDIAVLTWIGEQYAVRFDTLQKLLGRRAGESSNGVAEEGKIAVRNVRRILKRWQDMKLVQYRKFLHNEPGWVWLTGKGLREIGFAYRVYTPSAVSLRHFHHVNEVRLRLEKSYEDRLTWKCERALREEYEQLSDAEQRHHHVTDADITVDGKLIGIEVELTQKSSKRLVEIISKLTKQYPAVWYFVNDATQPVIEKIIEGKTKKIRIYHLSEVIE